MTDTAPSPSRLEAVPWHGRHQVRAAALFAVTFLVYRLTAAKQTAFDHYSRLAVAFRHGRVYLFDAPPWLELARIGRRGYVIDPPAPALLLLPATLVRGLADQVFWSTVVGAAVAPLCYLSARRMFGERIGIALAVLMCLGTNLWWATSDGALWTFAHVVAVFFSMAALYEVTHANRPLVAGLLLGLSGLSRLPVFLTFPFFAWKSMRERFDLRRLIVFGVGLGICAAAYLAYNYARYGTVLDIGYYHGQYAHEPWFASGRFDLTYIPRQLDAILFSGPVFTESYPWFLPSKQVMGLFFTTPAYLLTFAAPAGRTTLAALASFIAAGPLLTHGAVGFAQFGYRFALDLAVPLLVLTGLAFRGTITRKHMVLIAISVAVNLWGVLSFIKLNWVA